MTSSRKNITTTPTCIIAEIGVNHNGSLEKAIALVDICADAGVDIVKFQTFSAERIALRDAPKADYQMKQDGAGNQFDMLKELELSSDDYRILMERCTQKGVEFLSTAFDEIDLEMLITLGIKRIKIPSGEMTNLPYLRAVASHGLPVLLSTGMATMDEVKASVSALIAAGLPRDDLIILHCTSSYPAADEDLNLNAMVRMRTQIGIPVGYSDHSEDILASIIAASMGARVIEKHITLDKNLPGPDHAASIEPHELCDLVRAIRRKDVMTGSPLKQPTTAEMNTAAVARKSIIAKHPITKGAMLTADNMTLKRPGTGLSPMLWDDVIGTMAVKDFAPDEQIIIKDEA